MRGKLDKIVAINLGERVIKYHFGYWWSACVPKAEFMSKVKIKATLSYHAQPIRKSWYDHSNQFRWKGDQNEFLAIDAVVFPSWYLGVPGRLTAKTSRLDVVRPWSICPSSNHVCSGRLPSFLLLSSLSCKTINVYIIKLKVKLRWFRYFVNLFT